LSDLGDQARLLGERNERCRWHQATRWVHPAEQGLDAGDPSTGRGYDRFVLGAELPAPQRPVQIALQADVVFGEVLLVQVEELVVMPVLALCFVHCNIGIV